MVLLLLSMPEYFQGCNFSLLFPFFLLFPSVPLPLKSAVSGLSNCTPLWCTIWEFYLHLSCDKPALPSEAYSSETDRPVSCRKFQLGLHTDKQVSILSAVLIFIMFGALYCRTSEPWRMVHSRGVSEIIVNASLSHCWSLPYGTCTKTPWPQDLLQIISFSFS